jgi:nitric oxide reductase NorQ protein
MEINDVSTRSDAGKLPLRGDDLLLEPSEEFVTTPYVQAVTERALAYLEVGYAVHFSGPAGTGKTTLAFHVAALRGRALTLIHGDEECGSSDLVGSNAGYRKSKLIDNFIHSVYKTEEEMRSFWEENRLTTACRNGDTLIYDEFNRSRPEANNVLLSILSERILNLPKLRVSGEGYLQVHPEFRAIFTSNPEEYAGVHKAQDALMDRLITITLDHYDRESEVLITMSKSGICQRDAERIVDVVRELRTLGPNNSWPSIRACIAIARILSYLGGSARADDPLFQQVCRDVLNVNTVKFNRMEPAAMSQQLSDMIQRICGE